MQKTGYILALLLIKYQNLTIITKNMTVTDKTKKKKESTSPLAPVVNIATVQKEFGGPKGPEPTRYGDWEKKGRCIDF